MNLTAQIAAGEPEAWAIVDAHAVRLGGIAAGRNVSADDALQEMRIKVWRAAMNGVTFEGAGHLVKYSETAIRSVTIDAYRQSQFPSRKHTPVELFNADWTGIGAPDTAEMVEHADWRRRFWEVLEPYLRNPRERIAIGTLAVQHANKSAHATGTGGFKPTQVVAEWPHLFTDIQDVYDVRRSVLNRIRRNVGTMAKLRELREEAA